MRWARRTGLLVILLTAVIAGCGGSSSSNDTASPAGTAAPPTSTSSTGSLGATEFCSEADKILKGLDEQLAPALNPSETPANVEKTFKTIEDAYAKVIAIAPADIKPDLQAMSSAVVQLGQAYTKVNFDPSKAMAAIIPLLNDQKLTEATQRIGAWASANCTNVG